MKFELKKYNRNIPDEELISDLKNVAKTIERDTVTIAEYEQYGNYHPSTLQRRFGSWFAILKIANIKQSNWIDWEIGYCLKRITRKNRTSQTNGVLGVIQKINGSYDWFKSSTPQSDGCSYSSFLEYLVYDIISENRYNQTPKVYLCNTCKSINALTGSYISYVEEDDFLGNPQKYIDNAYDKSEKSGNGYDLTREK